MAAKVKLAFAILFLSVLFLHAEAKQDPELKQCKHQCRVQQQYDEDQKEACLQSCEEYYREKKEHGEGGDSDVWSLEDSQKKLKKCQLQCERLAGEIRQICRQQCEQKWGKEQKEEGGGDQNKKGKKDKKKKKEREEEEEEKEEEQEKEKEEEQRSPFVFEDKHFTTRVKTEAGRVDILTRFEELSKLLRGLENFRLSLLVANPNTFIVPNHLDANAVLVVTHGEGKMSLIREDKRESFTIKRGHIIWVPAGTPIYIANRDSEKLYIVKLLQSVNLPGQYEEFFGPGGQNPESIYPAFSWEILEAALKTSREKLEQLFQKQDQGPLFEASKEQIEALSDHEEGGGWPFGSQSRTTFSLFKNPSSQSNDYGQLFEVDSDDFRALKTLNVMVSYAIMSKGSMSGPMYNSEAIKVGIVVDGEGCLEIVCPHVASKSRSERTGSLPSYQKISAQLRVDTVFVVLAGHPYVTVASNNTNLEILYFEINAENNVRYPLAGKRNIVALMERAAKELAFKTRGEEVDEVFNKQQEEMFFPGPGCEQGRAYM